MLYITDNTTGTYYPDISVPVNLVSNDYLPFINLSDFPIGDTDFEYSIRTYYKPSIETDKVRSKTNSSRNIIESLTYARTLTKYVFTNNSYYIGQGIILGSRGEILMMLTVKKELILTHGRDSGYYNQGRNSFTYDNFILFLSSEVACSSEHSVFYRRLQKIYLEFCYEKGMETRIMSSSKIEKNTFASSLNIRFNSVSELDYHLRNEVQMFLMYEESVANDRTIHIDIPPIDVIVPIEVPQPTLDLDLSSLPDITSTSMLEMINGTSFNITSSMTGTNIVNSNGLTTFLNSTGTMPSFLTGIDPYTIEIPPSVVTDEVPISDVDPDIIQF